jgi:hypothetical protein
MNNPTIEINDKINKKIYKVYVLLKKNNNESFIFDYINKFIKLNQKKYLAIDLEYNLVSKTNRKVALLQLNFEETLSFTNNNHNYIFVIDPNILNKQQTKIIIKLLCSKNIIKILHGGESLDIPYLLNQLLNNNKKNIKNFLLNLYDTKYLCEYHHLLNNIEKKCSIYDLYFEFNIINSERYYYLSNIENITGPIYTIMIDINNLTPKLLEYAVYDVLYLVSLYKEFEKYNYKYISSIARTVFYYKRIPDNKYDLIISNNKSEMFYFILYTYIYPTKYYKLFQITYFKKFIENILNYIIINKHINILKHICWDKHFFHLIKKIFYLIKKYI